MQFGALTKCHLRRIMDSSVTLGRLELGRAAVSPGARLNGPGTKERGAQQQRAGPLGCVPLSHQVAGHKYGVDKVGQFTCRLLRFLSIAIHRSKFAPWLTRRRSARAKITGRI